MPFIKIKINGIEQVEFYVDSFSIDMKHPYMKQTPIVAQTNKSWFGNQPDERIFIINLKKQIH